jgi:bacterial/archaeal transporter family-2 protein
MFEYLFIIFIGLIGGAAVGFQSPIAGAMSQRVGGTAGSFIVHLSGAVLSGALLFLLGGEKIRDWRSLPWYMLLSGGFGLILYLTISVTLPRLGGTLMISLIIIGQLLIGLLVDNFGWLGVTVHPINLARIAGIILLIAGGYLIGK